MAKKLINNGLQWQYFPKSSKCPKDLLEVVDVFKDKYNEFDSFHHKKKSNDVLEDVRVGLEALDFEVEKSKKGGDKIKLPVLYGLNGKPKKEFDADAYSEEKGIVIEVEAGRAFANNQFLKDLFEACVIDGVKYCVIAVRQIYKGKDFQNVIQYLETLYSSNRFKLPLDGVLIIGY